MSLKEVAIELFSKKPMMACRAIAALDELLDEDFHDETIWDLYKAFISACVDRTC